MDIASKGNELMDRTLRTFDNVRDPKSFLLDLSKLEEAVDAGAQAQDMMAVHQALTSIAGPQNPPSNVVPGTLPPEPKQELAAPGVASAGVT
jgi:hypothetical protein